MITGLLLWLIINTDDSIYALFAPILFLTFVADLLIISNMLDYFGILDVY